MVYCGYEIASSCEALLDENNTNVTTPNILTDPVTTLLASTATPNVTLATLTTGSITTENATSDLTTIAPATTVTSIVTSVSATVANVTTPSTTNSSTTSTTMISTTAKTPGRKFDMLSFIGGIILAIGLSAIIYLIVSYLRRSNRLPYSNLR
ncbi:unnamed protein product [Rotaria sp. Silwood2]|nr:unnamed protein product [Rotaria sp. Silwood2]